MRTWIVRTGYAITLATVVWVITRLASQDGLARLLDMAAVHGNVIGLLLVAYVGVSMLQALAWWQLIRISAGQAAPGRSVGIFALTQLGKYLPGNVMHFVFRYALTRATGATRPAVLGATALEPWILLCAALAALALLGGTDWPAHFDWPGWLAWLLPIGALGLLAGILPWLRRRLPGNGLSLTALIPAFLLQAGFLLGSAGLFAVLLGLLDTSGVVPLQMVLAASVLAWLAGFVTPGSPGGLGVREVVLSLALSGWVPRADHRR
ncbi:MAG: hypothetical protein ACOC0Q_04505 [Wenzhouxiangella sp.]